MCRLLAMGGECGSGPHDQRIAIPAEAVGTSNARKARYPIRIALLGLVAIPLSALIAALAYDSYYQNQRSVADANRTTAAIAEITRTQTEQFLGRAEHILTELARRPQIRALDPARCDPLIANLQELQPAYANILTLDARGRLVCSAAGIAPEHAAGPDPKYYFAETIRTRGFTVGKPAKGFITGRWVSTLAYPIQGDEGQLTGVVALSVDLANFRPLFSGTSLPPGGVTGIVDGEGTLIARSEDAANRVGSAIDNVAVRQLLAQWRGAIRAPEYQGIDRFVAFTPIGHTDWISFASVDAAAVLAPARRLMLIHLAYAGAILLAIGMLTVLMARRIARPIEAMSVTIAAVRGGNLAVRAPVCGPTEISAMAREFNRMLAMRETAEVELRKSNAFARAILDSVTAEIAVLDTAGAIVAVNESWKRFALVNGIEPGKPVPHTEVGANYLAVCETSTGASSDEASSAGGGIRAVLDGSLPAFSLEYPCHSPDKKRWFIMSVTPLELKGRGAVVSHANITERVQAEQALQANEEKLRLFIAFAPSAIAMFDRDMRYLAYSRRWLADYDLDGQELTGRSHYEVFPDLPRRWKAIHQRCLAGAIETCDEDPFPRADGRVDWVRWEVHPWRTEQNDIGGIVVFSEVITQRKLAEEALRESESRLNEAQLNAQIGSWEWDLETDATLASVGLYRLFDLDPAKPMPNFHQQRGTLYPIEGWEQVNATLQHAARTGVGYDLVLEARKTDGTPIWIRSRGEAVHEATGRISGLHGTIQDVTATHRVEAALRKSEASLKTYSAELRGLTTRLAHAEETERSRLAQELHDRVGSSLTALNLNMTIMRAQLPPQSVATLGQRLDDSMALLEETTALVRSMMTNLRPPMLDDYGLAPALRWYSEQISSMTGLRVVVETAPDSLRRTAATEVALFRIAQEAINNALKHANARRVFVTLDEAPTLLTLTIVDDGRGFVTAEARGIDDGMPHWGLIMMRERAQSVGGRLRVHSSWGGGTRVIVEVPA